MKISSVFSLISKKIFEDVRYQSIRYNMFLKDFQINNINPLYVTGQFSILNDDITYFDDIDLNINEDSYYVYDEIGHSGEWSIKEYDSLKSVEEFILSPGGYVNMFCTHCVVFSKSNTFEFCICSEDINGDIHIIDKDFADEVKNLKVIWC